MITAKKFKKVVGVDPKDDDLDRCNCGMAGMTGHLDCGWDKKRDMPKFIPGTPKRN